MDTESIFPSLDNQDIYARLCQIKEEFDQLIKEGECIVWSCYVKKPAGRDSYQWDFRPDFRQVPPPWLDLSMRPHEDLAISLVRARVPEDDLQCHEISDQAFASNAPGYVQKYRVPMRDGRVVHVEETVTIQALASGGWHLVGICRDASQETGALPRLLDILNSENNRTPLLQRDLQEINTQMLLRDLQDVKQDLGLLMESCQWLIWSADVRRPHTNDTWWGWEFRLSFNQYLPEWFDVDRVDGEDLATTLSRVRLPEDDVQCNYLSEKALATGAPGYKQLFRVRLRDGRVSWVEENVTIQPIGPAQWHLVGICIDATERKDSEEYLQNLQIELTAQNDELQCIQAELESQNEELHLLRQKLEDDKTALAEANLRLESLATTDGLTGIKNHRAFQERLEEEWRAAVRFDTPLSLVLLDIDHFKQFNDSYGHPAGDAILIEVGRLLHENARGNECIARYGGEEFVVILPATDKCGAMALAERFRARLEQSTWGHRPITASFGVATTSHLIHDPQSLIVEADQALYQAKAEGRNRVCHAEHSGQIVNS